MKDIEATLTKDSVGFPKINPGYNNLQTNDFLGMGLTASNFKVQPYSTRTTLSQSMNFGSGGLRSDSGLSINEKPKDNNAEKLFIKRLEFLKN